MMLYPLVATALIMTIIGTPGAAWAQKVTGSLGGTAGGAAASLGTTPSGTFTLTPGVMLGGVSGASPAPSGSSLDDITMNAGPAAVSVNVKVFKFKF